MAALLAEKAYQCGYAVYILCESASNAAQLDALLWDYREDACLPHQRYEPQTYNPHIPIQIGDLSMTECPPAHILINMSQEVPTFYQAFQSVIELVPDEVVRRQKAREKYRFYQRAKEQLVTQNVLGIPELPVFLG